MLRNYLTAELAEELCLFAYGPACDCPPNPRQPCPRCGQVIIKSRELEPVVEGLLQSRYNYGVPKVVISDTAGGVLRLEHDEAGAPLDREYAEKTLEYINELWKAPVVLVCHNERGERIELVHDEDGPRVSVKASRPRFRS